MANPAKELASYYVSVSLNTQGMGKDITKNLSKDFNNAFGNVESQASKRGEGIGSKLSAAAGKTLKRAFAATGIAAGGTLAAGIAKGFGRLSAIQEAEKKLEGLGRSTAEIGSIMDSVKGSVKGTAFGLDEAANAAAIFSTVGVKSGHDMDRAMKLLSDTTAQANSTFGEMGPIFGKIAAEGGLTTMTFDMLNERATGVGEALSKHLGIPIEEVRAKAKDIDFDTFAEAMEKNIGGAALKTGETFKGAFANMGAALGRLGAELIRPAFENAPKVFASLTDALDGATDAAPELAQKFWGEVSPAIEGIADSVSATVSGLPAMWDKAKANPLVAATINTVKDTLANLWELAKNMGPALANIGKGAFVAAFAALGGTINALSPVINGVLLPALTKVSEFLADNAGVAKLLGGVLAGVFLHGKAVTGIGLLKTGLVDLRGTITTGIGAVKAFGASFTPVIGALRAVGAVMLANPIGMIIAGVVAAGAALWAFFTKTETGRQMFARMSETVKAAWDAISVKLTEVWEGVLQPVFEALWGKARAVFGWLAHIVGNVLTAVWGALGTAVTTVWETVLQPVWEAIKIAWSLLVVAIYGYWLNVLKPMFTAIGTVFKAMWDMVLLPAWNALQAAWGVLVGAVRNLWDTVLRLTFTAIGQVFTGMWNGVLQPAFNAMRAVWGSVLNVMRSIWETVLKPTFEAIGRVISVVVDTVVKPALSRMREAFGKVQSFVSTVVDAIGNVWSKLRGILAKPINFLINAVWNRGVLSVWRNAKRFLPVVDPPANLPPIGGYAKGGAVFGAGTGTSDSILARLSHGEHVLTAKEVKAFGGHRVVEALRSLALSGREITPCLLNQLAAMGGHGLRQVAASRHGDGKRGDIGGLLAFAKGGAVLLDDRELKKAPPPWMAGVNRGHQWAKARHGRPYVWGGSAHGSGGTDCSGFMSGIADVILGGNGARKWATMAFNTSAGDQVVAGQRWKKGLGPGFSIGVWNGGSAGGHTYGTLGKTNKYGAVNVESGGSPSMVKYGPGAAGADDPQTAKGSAYHLAIGADGQFLSGGVGGMSPEAKRGFLFKKIKEIFDKIFQPLRANIARIVGRPDIVPRQIPHEALKMLPKKLLGQMRKVIDNLGDKLGAAYDKASEIKDWVFDRIKGPFLRDQGGWLPPGPSLVWNKTGKPEMVLTSEQYSTVERLLAAAGRPDLTERVNDYVRVDDGERERTPAEEIAHSAAKWAADDFFEFVGLGSSDNVLTNPSKSFAGTVMDMVINPHKYQRTDSDVSAGRATDEETIASTTAEAIEDTYVEPVEDSAPAPVEPARGGGGGGGGTTGIDNSGDGTGDYQYERVKEGSKVEAPAISGDDPGGSGVGRWVPLIKDMLKHYGHPASWLDVTKRRMQQESGGNPRAVNNWDSNASAGMPSVGLMQVIRPTYAAHKDGKFDKGPYLHGVSTNGAANLAASMRYTMQRYGSLPAGYGRAGGYFRGGPVYGPGTSLSDSIPALLSSGEYVVRATQARKHRALLDVINSGVSVATGAIGGGLAAASAPADTGDRGPLVHVDNITTTDEHEAMRQLQRFASRATRSAGLYGGR